MNKIIINEEVKRSFEEISSRLYNFKYALDYFVLNLENDNTMMLNTTCLSLVLKEYYNVTKEKYNKLEENLGLLF